MWILPPPESSFGFLVKYDNETGKLLWQRRFAVEVWTEGHTQAVNDAGIFVGGQAYKSGDTPGFAPPVGFVRMFSHDGAVLWTKRDEKKMRGVWAAVADATGVYVGGTNADNAGANRAVVRRLSNDGDYIWTRENRQQAGKEKETETKVRSIHGRAPPPVILAGQCAFLPLPDCSVDENSG